VATENSLKTVPPPQERPWLFPPGRSANPGGRPKGIGSLVREQTRDGAELVAFMLAVLRGRKKAPLRLRMEAAAWLADRGFGKALQQVEVGNMEGEEIVFRIVDARGAPDADPQRLP
jgi:hypothetical protein